jgi:hypothetical protein
MRIQNGFDSSYVALLAGLWEEMEALLGAHYAGDPVGADTEGAGIRAEALLLELALLSERCESLRHQSLITPESAATMRALIDEVSDLLDFDPLDCALGRAGAALAQAQNRIFDELQRIGMRVTSPSALS